jgi:predicted peptidase
MAPRKLAPINNPMVWKSILNFALIGWIFLSIPCCEVQANGDIPELRRKIADIVLLRKQLGDRQRQAESAIEALIKQDNALIAEAHLLISSFKIRTFEDARQNQRLRYDMELLGTIAAYRQAFEEKIRLYQTGQDKLVYLQQMAQDDAKMVSALNDFQIDALATQISLVINQYLNEAHTIKIDPQAIEPLSSRQVWKQLAADAKS